MADKSPAEILNDMINGFKNTQMVYVAAKLGIADLLKDGPKSVEEISPTIAVNDQTLFRILRGLVVCGLLVQEDDGRFKLTEIGECLRTDIIPDLMYDQIIMTSKFIYPVWGALLHSIQTEEIAFNHVFDMGWFEYCEHSPEFGKRFNRIMMNATLGMAETIIAAYDFTSVTKIVDVAGGYGTLITEILKANPKMTGLLFEMESVVEGAKKYLSDAGVAKRCEIASGSMFDSIPDGDGSYILKWILHDWDDENCIRILKNCHRAMDKKSKLLIIEHVIPERVDHSTSTVAADLMMMLLLQGRERTETEFRSLFVSAGFQLDQVIPTESGFSVLECVPV